MRSRCILSAPVLTLSTRQIYRRVGEKHDKSRHQFELWHQATRKLCTNKEDLHELSSSRKKLWIKLFRIDLSFIFFKKSLIIYLREINVLTLHKFLYTLYSCVFAYHQNARMLSQKEYRREIMKKVSKIPRRR